MIFNRILKIGALAPFFLPCIFFNSDLSKDYYFSKELNKHNENSSSFNSSLQYFICKCPKGFYSDFTTEK